MEAALAAGITYPDSAPPYGGGRNESVLGEVLKSRPRGSFLVGTKAGLPEDPVTGLLPEGLTQEALDASIRQSLDASLKRLQLEHVDVLYLYGPARSPELSAGPQDTGGVVDVRFSAG